MRSKIFSKQSTSGGLSYHVTHRTWLSVALLSLCLFAPAAFLRAQEPKTAAGPKTVRLLTVGNSFSQNATRHLGSLAKASGHTLIHHPAVIGGATMAQHWEKVEQHEKDPLDPRGLYGTKRSLKQELLSEKWDVVTIQQASIKSHDVTTYRPYARQLYDFIKQHASQAEVVVHETWAYRRDDPRFAITSPAPGEPATQEAMYHGLKQSYATIATELKVRQIPVGNAFYLADTDPQWGFRPDTKFDLKNAVHPVLPDQTHSLHVGWRWMKQPNDTYSLRMDGHHANTAGEYLGACVFYESLFHESPIGNEFIPDGVDKEYARFLQETAHRAVMESRAKEPATK